MFEHEQLQCCTSALSFEIFAQVVKKEKWRRRESNPRPQCLG